MNNKEKKYVGYNSKGITLVALVITIIIIIILATLTINYAFGENGLIKRAESAGKFYANDTKYTDGSITNVESYINDILEGTGGNEEQIPTPPGGSVTEDGVPIPERFYYVGGTKEEGVVISDNAADEGKGTSHDVAVNTLQGNQFVWVPVENPDEYFEVKTVKLYGVETTTDVYSKLTIRDIDKEDLASGEPGNSSSRLVREPEVLYRYDTDAKYYQDILEYESTKEMADSFVEEYERMYISIKKYKGFYIGRYELTGTLDTPTVKSGAVIPVLNFLEGNWYGLRKACTEIIKNNSNVESTMIYGVQWDATMNWLKNTKFLGEPEKVDEDSSSWGNYSNSSEEAAIEGAGKKQNTGYSEAWSANNIYDLAGNHMEWTQEANSTGSRTLRGRCV